MLVFIHAEQQISAKPYKTRALLILPLSEKLTITLRYTCFLVFWKQYTTYSVIWLSVVLLCYNKGPLDKHSICLLLSSVVCLYYISVCLLWWLWDIMSCSSDAHITDAVSLHILPCVSFCAVWNLIGSMQNTTNKYCIWIMQTVCAAELNAEESY